MLDVITINEAAQLLGCSQSFIYRRLDKGIAPLPHFYVGRSLRFRRSDLERWIVERTEAATPRWKKGGKA